MALKRACMGLLLWPSVSGLCDLLLTPSLLGYHALRDTFPAIALGIPTARILALFCIIAVWLRSQSPKITIMRKRTLWRESMRAPCGLRSTVWFLRQQYARNRRNWASVSRYGLAKEDVSTDNQEDSGADPQALKESRQTAVDTENVDTNRTYDSETAGKAKYDPEVADKSGKGFPHQSPEDRKSRVASTTEGEAHVKTREYTPKDGTALYEEK